MASVSWTRPALRDVAHIRDTLGSDAVPQTHLVCERLVETAGQLAQLPAGSRCVPEFDHDHVREVFVRPYRLIYEIRGTDCFILAVIHANRDVPRAFQ